MDKEADVMDVQNKLGITISDLLWYIPWHPKLLEY